VEIKNNTEILLKMEAKIGQITSNVCKERLTYKTEVRSVNNKARNEHE
jgi:hypothetical protein